MSGQVRIGHVKTGKVKTCRQDGARQERSSIPVSQCPSHLGDGKPHRGVDKHTIFGTDALTQ